MKTNINIIVIFVNPIFIKYDVIKDETLFV